MTISLTHLPYEILVNIFIVSENIHLPFVHSTFYRASKSYQTRAAWLIHKYGTDRALIHAWDYGFMHHDGDGNRCPCPHLLKVLMKGALSLQEDELGADHRNQVDVDVTMDAEGRDFNRQESQDTIVPISDDTPTNHPIHVLMDASYIRVAKEHFHASYNRFRGMWTSIMFWNQRKHLAKNIWDKSLQSKAKSDILTYHPCCLEAKQIQLVKYILDTYKCDPIGLDVTLVIATYYGHFELMRVVLALGAHPFQKFPIFRDFGKPHSSIFKSTSTLSKQKLPFRRLRSQLIRGSNHVLSKSSFQESFQTVFQQEFEEDPVPAVGNPQPGPVVSDPGMRLRAFLDQIDWDPTVQEIQPRNYFSYDYHAMKSLFYVAVTSNHLPLLVLLFEYRLTETTTESRRQTLLRLASEEDLSNAVLYCFQRGQFLMARYLIDQQGATITVKMLSILLSRAGSMRVFGINTEKFQSTTVLALKALKDIDFEAISPNILRAMSELGFKDGVELALARGADVNAMEGVALYAAVYNGNVEVVKYLLSLPNLRVLSFSTKNWSVCLTILVVETIAFIFFVSLVSVWIYVGDQSNWGRQDLDNASLIGADISATVSAFGHLSGLVCASAFAIVVMYMIVPFHRIVYSLNLVARAQKQARSRMETTVPRPVWSFFRHHGSAVETEETDIELEQV